MRNLFRWVVVLLVLLAAVGCASMPDDASHVTYVLVRHAEKATDDPRDPSLSAAGVERARRLARKLHDAPVVAVYSTAFQRTRQTAAPTAADHRLPVTVYDGSEPADAFAARLRGSHEHGTVLIVGHSNTVPPLAQALCGCAIDPMGDHEFGRRITITVLRDGRATVDDRREP